MRLATIHTTNGPRAAVIRDEFLIDVNASDPNLPTSVRGLIEAGPDALKAVETATNSDKAVKISVAGATLLAPIVDPPKILCIGLNYRDHAAEGGHPIPEEPVVFGKFSNALIGHSAPIRLPKVSEKVDYEAELVVVIGKKGRNISEANALDHVAGYTCGHDVSARDWQLKGAEKQWIIGKTFDTFAPVGPALVTTDQLTDPHNLRIQLRLNGQSRQDSNTKEFIFTVPKLIAYLSQVMTLTPGDLIFTGTPPGVGVARKPPEFLKPGDMVEVEIEGIGVLMNPVTAGE